MSSKSIDGSVTFNGYVGDDGSGNFSGTTKGDDKPVVNSSKDDKSKNQISNYFSFNFKKLKNYANNLKKSLWDAQNTNLIIYGNGKASDNFLGGEFKKGGKTITMDLGKDNQIFWLMTVYAPSRQVDDGGIGNLIDLFGDSHPIFQDKDYVESRDYKGLYKNINQSTYVGHEKGYVQYTGNYYLPISVYNQASTEYKYFLIGVTQQQAKSGIYKKIIEKYK
jgi:hypothetical protein